MQQSYAAICLISTRKVPPHGLDFRVTASLKSQCIPEDGSKGNILEVDLKYPEELHGAHDQYPLAPEKILVTNDMLSSYSKRLKDKFDMLRCVKP